MKGKLIVVEAGSDACGKTTQTKLLYDHLLTDNYNVRMIKFPNYSCPSSTLVKMYLGGELGKNPDDVNAFAASAFYAVDRYVSYVQEWRDFYLDGGIIIADRYTTSNMVHQAAKIDDIEERDRFLDWLRDFEFTKLGLPSPDEVYFLDVPIEISIKLLKERNQAQKSKTHDIHEESKHHLEMAYHTACQVAQKNNWKHIICTVQDRLLSIEEIHKLIYQEAKSILS